jgi:hypothetical protein
VARGNFFFENASSTYRKEANIEAAGGAPQETDVKGSELGIPNLISTSLIGVDTLELGAAKLTNFPVGIPRNNWDHGNTVLHAMGIGSNSTLLNRLVETGQTASRVWSMFWGRLWVDNPIDGSLVLGGYDSNKVIGQNYTQPLDYSGGCWTGMKVCITGMDLVFQNGKTTSTLPPGMTVDVCIVPQRQLLMQGPLQILHLFENVTKTKNIGTSYTEVHWDAATYDAKSAYDPAWKGIFPRVETTIYSANQTSGNRYGGSMVISLSSGLQVTLPNDQFMVPLVSIERNGSRIFNESRRDFLYQGIAEGQPYTLGRYFLTSAYLMVNHDDHTFTLWQANPSATSQLVPFPEPKTNTEAACTAVAGQPPPTDKPGTPDGAQSSGSLSGGAIAGITIGAVTLLGMMTLGALYVRRRRSQPLHFMGAEVEQNDMCKSIDAGGQCVGQGTMYELPQDGRPPEVHGSGLEHAVPELP